MGQNLRNADKRHDKQIFLIDIKKYICIAPVQNRNPLLKLLLVELICIVSHELEENQF